MFTRRLNLTQEAQAHDGRSGVRYLFSFSFLANVHRNLTFRTLKERT